MKAVIQRVKQAEVKVLGQSVGRIDQGLAVLLAIAETDTLSQAKAMAEKIINLRLFGDEQNKMNLSVKEIGGQILVVSQFTLYGDCRRGNRPSFTKAAKGQLAVNLYETLIDLLKTSGLKVATGNFGADMALELINDGPVTLIVEI